MMGQDAPKQRMSLGFGDDLDVTDDAGNGGGEGALPALDLGAFQPKKRARVAAPELADTRKLAEAVGFRSREPKAEMANGGVAAGPLTGPERGRGGDEASASTPPSAGTAGAGTPLHIHPPVAATPPAGSAVHASAAVPVQAPPRRRRTGRNVQFNIKARPETIAAFTAIADANDWGFGETLEHAVALMEAQGARTPSDRT